MVGKDGRSCVTAIFFIILRDLMDEAREGMFANEKVRRLLVATDPAEGNSSGAVTVGLRGASLAGGALAGGAGGLGGKLSARRFASG